jgi:hypothetical protein
MSPIDLAQLSWYTTACVSEFAPRVPTYHADVLSKGLRSWVAESLTKLLFTRSVACSRCEPDAKDCAHNTTHQRASQACILSLGHSSLDAAADKEADYEAGTTAEHRRNDLTGLAVGATLSLPRLDRAQEQHSDENRSQGSAGYDVELGRDMSHSALGFRRL